MEIPKTTMARKKKIAGLRKKINSLKKQINMTLKELEKFSSNRSKYYGDNANSKDLHAHLKRYKRAAIKHESLLKKLNYAQLDVYRLQRGFK